MHIKPLEKTQQDGTPPRGSDSVSIRVNSSSHIFALGMLLHSACVRVTSGGFSLGEYLRGEISGGYLRGNISGGTSQGRISPGGISPEGISPGGIYPRTSPRTQARTTDSLLRRMQLHKQAGR